MNPQNATSFTQTHLSTGGAQARFRGVHTPRRSIASGRLHVETPRSLNLGSEGGFRVLRFYRVFWVFRVYGIYKVSRVYRASKVYGGHRVQRVKRVYKV